MAECTVVEFAVGMDNSQCDSHSVNLSGDTSQTVGLACETIGEKYMIVCVWYEIWLVSYLLRLAPGQCTQHLSSTL